MFAPAGPADTKQALGKPQLSHRLSTQLGVAIVVPVEPRWIYPAKVGLPFGLGLDPKLQLQLQP